MSPALRLALASCALLVACGGGGNTTDGGGTGGACLESGKSPANIVRDYSFECSDAGTSADWTPVFGALDFPEGDAHTGARAARLTATSTSTTRFAYAPDLVADGGTGTWCAAAWAKGTVPYMRMRVLQDGNANPTAFEFNAPVTATWTRVPPSINLPAPNENAKRLLLVFEMQTNRGDGQNAKVGDTLLIDDVDVWQSSDGLCRETR